MKNIKEIEIKIEGEVWEKALDKAFKKKNKEVTIEGFRKGFAPKNIFLKKFGIEYLYPDAVDFCIDEAYKEAMKKANIVPIIEPKLDITTINAKEVVMKFTITAKPEVTLGEYKNLGIKKETVKVSKKEIDEEIEKLRNQLAEITPKENGQVENGDTAIIDFDGFVDGKPLEGGSSKNYSLEIGSHSFIPGFEEGIIGMAINDTKELNLKFPDNYLDDLKNKDVLFKVTLKEIKSRIVPELNEDFYQDLGYDNIKTEEEFRKEVESVIKERKTVDIEDMHLDKCLEKASENLKVELSSDIIDDEVHRMMKQQEEYLKKEGIKLDDYMKFTGMTHEKMHEQMEPEAIKRIKYRYLLEEVAKAEKIDFTKEEVEAKTKEMADNYGITVDELIKAYGSMDVVKYDMMMHKALETIKENN